MLWQKDSDLAFLRQWGDFNPMQMRLDSVKTGAKFFPPSPVLARRSRVSHLCGLGITG